MNQQDIKMVYSDVLTILQIKCKIYVKYKFFYFFV